MNSSKASPLVDIVVQDSKEGNHDESSKAETFKDEDGKIYIVDRSFNEQSGFLDKSQTPLQTGTSSKLSRGSTIGTSVKRTSCFNFERKNMKFNGTPIDVIIETEVDPIKTVFLNIKNGGFKGVCAFILINRFFSILRVVFILFTSFSLGIDRYPQSIKEAKFQRVSHIICTTFFIIENLLLIVGGGYLNFFKEPFYVIDLVINFVSRPTSDLRRAAVHH